MSLVNRMEIRGIRSYNPNKSAQIEFPVPVTMILGHNGSGKTTIIECLKFACTGEQPAGNKGCFVHDPKLADENEIRGQVKLQFTDTAGKSGTVSKTLLSKALQNSNSTKTLDGCIKRIGKDGKVESISKKCADLDKEMIRSLGVSKSVLTNVIFCHQEDSMWPLAEGTLVKKKFDEIFGQKRHVKFVEELRTKFKELKRDNQLQQVELTFLKQNTGKAGELEEELDRAEQKMSHGKQDVADVNKKIEDLKAKLDESHTKVKEVQSLEKKKDAFVTRLDTEQTTQSQLEERLNTNYPHPTDKLLQMLSTFERDFQDKRTREHEYTVRLSDVSDSYEKATKNLNSYNIELARLKEAQKTYQKLHADKEAMLKSLIINFESSSEELLGTRVTATDECNVIHWVETQLDESRRREEKRRTESAIAQKEAQTKMDQINKSINQAQGEINVQRETRKKVKEEMDKLLVEIHQIKTSAASLARLEKDKKSADDEYQRFLSDSRLGDIAAKVEQKSKAMKEIADKQSELSSELEILNLEAEARQDRERADAELSEKEAKIQSLLTKHESSIKFHLGTMPSPREHSKTLSEYLVKKKAESKLQNKKLVSQQRSLTEKESELKMAKRQLKECEDKMRHVRNKIIEVCANPALYESEVERAELEYKQAKQSVSGSTSFQYLYGRWRDKLDQTHTCPLCKTGLDDTRTRSVVASMTQKIDKAPESLVEKKKQEKVSEQRFFALKSAAALYTQLNELEKDKIPQLSEKVTKLSAEIEEDVELIDDITDSIDTLTLLEVEARAIEKDLDYVDRLQGECVRLKDKISDFSSRLVSSYTKTLKEAIEEQSKYQDEYNVLRDDYSRLTDNKTRAENKRNALQQKCNTLKQQHLDLNYKMQGLKGKEERRKEKALEIQELSKGERTIEEKMQPAKEELEGLETKLSNLKDESSTRQRDVGSILNKLGNEVENARKMEKELSMNRGLGGADLTRLTERIAQSESESESLRTQKKKVESQLQQIQRDLDSSQVQKRDLEDCVQLRKLEQQIKGIKVQITEVETKLTNKDLVSARTNTNKLQAAMEDQGRQKAGQEGRNRGFLDQIGRLKRELSSGMFKDAAEKCHNQEIKCTVGTMAAKDIDMYIIAYERAIMRFHGDKMQEINNSLRVLWVNIYRGGDIDYIEIRTDEDGAESASRRKTCHYRVVMVTGGVAVNMRAHSSAGQRVLAALLIRLALAETFCDKCGIIALDEPTTNLDRDNIDSLAGALSTFIRLRQGFGNFQLIVITHDEDFVELLGRSEYIDHYYQVSKDSQQFSVITKKSVAGLADKV